MPRMDPNAFLKAVYASMKPGGVIGVIDHVANANSDTRATVEKFHRIDPDVVKADFKRAGFVLVGSSDLLRNPADDHSTSRFTTRRLPARPTASFSSSRSRVEQRLRPRQSRAARRASFRAYYALAALIVGLALGALPANLARRRARHALGHRELRRHLVAQRAEDDRHSIGRRTARRRHRQERRSGAWRAHRRPLGAVDRASSAPRRRCSARITVRPLTRIVSVGARNGERAPRRAWRRRAEGVGAASGHRRFLQGRRARQRVRRGDNGDILPLVVFSRAVRARSRRDRRQGRSSIVDLFEAIGDALLVIIAWVLWIAPLGVLALAFTVGSAAGGAAFAGLGHYVVRHFGRSASSSRCCGYPLVVIAGRIVAGAIHAGR